MLKYKSSYRKQRIARVLMEALAMILNKKSTQWSSSIITLSRVKMSGDLRIAFVYFSYIEREGAVTVEEVNQLLNDHAAQIRRQLASQVHLRFVPQLRFEREREIGWMQWVEPLAD